MTIKKTLVSILIAFLLGTLLSAQTSSGYAKVPFTVEDGYILLPCTCFDKVELKLVFDTMENVSMLNESGIKKFSELFGEDLYGLLRKTMKSRNPNLTEVQIDAEMQPIHEGQLSMMAVKSIRSGGWFFPKVSFFDARSLVRAGDGSICLDAFGDVRNIIIDSRNKVLEINAPLHKKNGVRLHRTDTEVMENVYYVMCELDGVEQPFVISTFFPIMIVRENTNEGTVYDGKTLDKAFSDFRKRGQAEPLHVESCAAEIKVGGLRQEFQFCKSNVEPLLFNILGLPFFEGKCVQLDFEHMMMYMW